MLKFDGFGGEKVKLFHVVNLQLIRVMKPNDSKYWSIQEDLSFLCEIFISFSCLNQ